MENRNLLNAEVYGKPVSNPNKKQEVVSTNTPMTSVKYQLSTGEDITLDFEIVKNYITGNQNVTDQEAVMFMQLCKHQKLNPFLREAYLVKYGTQQASLVVGKEAFTKRAEAQPDFLGQEAGVVILQKNGEVINREGTLVVPQAGEKIIGGWAKVYRKGYHYPIFISVNLDEYVGKKADGTINSMWSTKAGTMIRKVALTQALREAFPQSLGGMYIEDEMGVPVAENTVVNDMDSLIKNDKNPTTNKVEIIVDNDLPSSMPINNKNEISDAEFVEADISSVQELIEPIITTAQATRIFAISKGNKDLCSEVALSFGYKNSKEIKVKDYEEICRIVKERTEKNV